MASGGKLAFKRAPATVHDSETSDFSTSDSGTDDSNTSSDVKIPSPKRIKGQNKNNKTKKQKKSWAPKSFTNPGINVCFLNAAINYLKAVPPIKQACTDGLHSKSCAIPPGACFMCTFERTVRESKRKTRSTETLAHLYTFLNPAYEQVGDQFDTNEVIDNILNSYKEGPRFPEKGFQPAYGFETEKIMSQIRQRVVVHTKCKSCSHERNIEKQALFHRIRVSGPILGLLEKQKETVKDRDCVHCGSKCDHEFKTSSELTSKYGLIALDRAKQEHGQNVKDTSPVFAPFFTKKGNNVLVTTAWVRHSGTAKNGHYTAARFEKNGVWEFNDATVTKKATLTMDQDATAVLFTKVK